MTYEELKAEAKAQGYNLIKIPPKVPHNKCTCGKSASIWYCQGNFRQIHCNHCGLKGEVCSSERAAWEAWNRMVADEH